jgi:Trk K+ transport system NAD-binding subunit
MIGSFNHMLSLIVVSMIAYLIADIAKVKPIYEELLERSLHKQGKTAVSSTAKKRMLLEVGISIGSKLDGRHIKDVDWPQHCLLVSVKRGDSELVPKGDTRIMVGDYLYVLTNTDQAKKIRELAEECIPQI